MLAFLKLMLEFKLESRVASALFGPSASQGHLVIFLRRCVFQSLGFKLGFGVASALFGPSAR